MLTGTTYEGRAADVWSCGCILFIMATGTMPYDDANKSDQIQQMKKAPSFSQTKQSLSFDVVDLIKRILNIDPERRPTLTDIFYDPWTTLDANVMKQDRKKDADEDKEIEIEKEIVLWDDVVEYKKGDEKNNIY